MSTAGSDPALRRRLAIEGRRLRELDRFLLGPRNPLVNRLLAVVERFGGLQAINPQAVEAGRLENCARA